MDKVYWQKPDANIWAADMKDMEAKSKISDTFNGATIFLTGATGFLGKLFMEKLLRCSPKLKMIYILVRPKKGKDVEKRFEEIFDGPNMVPLKLSNPKALDKVALISGDCRLPDLGMDEDSKKKIIEEVNFVIHCAATVRFDQDLKTAAYINVRAVRDLVAIAKQMKGLKAFLHVSTAFSHCVRKDIDEEYYNPAMTPEKLLDLVEDLDEDRLNAITLGLIGKWPNTYAFTKAIAEDIVRREISNLPIAMIRPSIVISTVNEPVKGYIDNVYGPSGVLLGAALGAIRTSRGRIGNTAEMIPADYVINAGLAVIWDMVERRNKEIQKIPHDIPSEKNTVFNIVSSTETPIRWSEFMQLAHKHGPNVPSEHQIWHNFFAVRENPHLYVASVFLLHTLPAYLVDFICMCLGKEQRMVQGYKKINKFLDVLAYFTLREWRFSNFNLQSLWERMEPEDQKRYPFTMKNFDWDDFFSYYLKGGRVYILKDPLETIPKGRIWYWKLFVAHYTLMAVLLYLFAKLLCLLCRCIF